MAVDPANPLHAASFWVEELKYGPGPGKLERATTDQFSAQLEQLIEATGADVTADQIIDALGFYGDSLARQLNLGPLIAKSIFADGVMHGMALAAGLRGAPREGRAA